MIKQLHHLLKTTRIFAWSRYLQNLISVGAIHRFIFSFFFSYKSKLQLTQKDRADTQMNRSSTSSEISFHEQLSESKRPSIRKQVASLLSSLNRYQFLRNSYLQKDIQQTFFTSIFMNFQKILAAHQSQFRKVLQSPQNTMRAKVLYQ